MTTYGPDKVELTATKATAWILVALDSNGWPLSHGQRMVEVAPGRFMDRDWYDMASHAGCLDIFGAQA